MPAGNCYRSSSLRSHWAALALLLVCVQASAIDNPEAPDRMASFEGRASPFEQALAETDGGTPARRAGADYARILEAEMNTTYRRLLARLRPEARAALAKSQLAWHRFRAVESAFIDSQWTLQSHGSSAQLSIAQFQTALTKQRVVQLLRYEAEYP